MKRIVLFFLLFIALCFALLYVDYKKTNIIIPYIESIFFINSDENTIVKNPEHVWIEPSSAPIVYLKTTPSSTIQISTKEFIMHHVVLFIYPTATKTVRFFIIKEGIRDQTKYRAVADASELCSEKKQGFDYKDKYFISRQCEISYHSERVGIASGGTNPIPIPITYTEENIEITKENLAKIVQMF